MIEEEIIEKLSQIAEENNVKIDLNVAQRIARFKSARGQSLGICICDPDNPYRGCIGSACVKELKENGACHCNLFSTK